MKIFDPQYDATINGPAKSEIAKRTGLTNEEVDRIGDECQAEGIIRCMGGSGEIRGGFVFTRRGQQLAEKIQSEKFKDRLATGRKTIAAPKEGGMTLGKKVLVSVAGIMGSIILAVISFLELHEQMIKLLKQQLGP